MNKKFCGVWATFQYLDDFCNAIKDLRQQNMKKILVILILKSLFITSTLAQDYPLSLGLFGDINNTPKFNKKVINTDIIGDFEKVPGSGITLETKIPNTNLSIVIGRTGATTPEHDRLKKEPIFYPFLRKGQNRHEVHIPIPDDINRLIDNVQTYSVDRFTQTSQGVFYTATEKVSGNVDVIYEGAVTNVRIGEDVTLFASDGTFLYKGNSSSSSNSSSNFFKVVDEDGNTVYFGNISNTANNIIDSISSGSETMGIGGINSDGSRYYDIYNNGERVVYTHDTIFVNINETGITLPVTITSFSSFAIRETFLGTRYYFADADTENDFSNLDLFAGGGLTDLSFEVCYSYTTYTIIIILDSIFIGNIAKIYSITIFINYFKKI